MKTLRQLSQEFGVSVNTITHYSNQLGLVPVYNIYRERVFVDHEVDMMAELRKAKQARRGRPKTIKN